MPFDPNLPAANSPLDSAEMRDQLNSLKAYIDQMETDLAATAGRVGSVQQLQLSISNPPTKAEVEAVRDKLNELIGALAP